MSHITGGGIIGNTMRIIPKGLQLKIDWLAWQRPFIFDFLQAVGNVPEHDMTRTFNLGVGLIFVIDPKNVDKAVWLLKKNNEQPFIMGEVT